MDNNENRNTQKPEPAFLRSEYPYQAVGDSITDMDLLEADVIYEIKCSECKMIIRSQGQNIKSMYERMMAGNGCIGCGSSNLMVRKVDIFSED